MTKRILITAGPTYGRLDANKIVSNRSRGLWAVEFAQWLDYWSRWNGGNERCQAILLVPDLFEKAVREKVGPVTSHKILTHDGYDNYRAQCNELAPEVDAAIMAAAVVNWIPETPFKGKMPTSLPGKSERLMIPFILAPRVINEMRNLNPKITLIGCKLLFSDDYDTLIDAAYHVVLAARCNAVIANDAKLGLKKKFVVHQDRSVTQFEDDFDGLYEHLLGIIEDVHYRTVVVEGPLGLRSEDYTRAVQQSNLFDHLVELHRKDFVKRQEGEDFVLGAVAVRYPGGRYLVSPREKSKMFTSQDAVLVDRVEDRTVYVQEGKASLNAPLLIRHLDAYPNARGVIHYHDSDDCIQPGIHVGYAPPGTARDNERKILGPTYSIRGHGWIVAVDRDGNRIDES